MVRCPIASKIFVVGGLVCSNVSGLFGGAKLLAIMESARRWSIKWVELKRVLIPAQTYATPVVTVHSRIDFVSQTRRGS
jgi:hypothetical protein